MNSYNYSYNVLINRLEAFAAGHLLIKRFTHGQIDLADMDQNEQYPFMHVVPNNIKPVEGGMQFDFQILFADIPRDKETKAEYQREVISDCVRLAQDLIAEVKNGLILFGFDVQLVTPPVIEPFVEEYKNTLTGVSFSLQLEVPWDWSACDIPAVWSVGGTSSGGTGNAYGITLKTNGVNNAVQNILDLVAGTNVTITDNGDGSVTFDAAGGGATVLVSTEFNVNHTTATGNQYVIGDRVWYNGNVYACIANNDSLLPTNAAYWTLQGAGFRLRQSPVDWNASSGDYQILNKPILATVATTGSYDDLIDQPSIPKFLDNLDDVEVPSPVIGDMFYFNGTEWVNIPGKDYAEVNINLTNLNGVDTSGATTGQVLTYQSTGEWKPQTVSGGSGTVTSVALTMPSAFAVTGSPITAAGTLAVTGAGLATQYVRGDGQLANFPTTSGGGSSVSYYLNGSINQGVIGGSTYYQMSKTAIFGAGTDFTRTNAAGNGLIAQFITDVNDPNVLLVPGGNFNLELYFSASSSGGSPSFYVELYKYDGSTFTLLATDVATPEGITQGTVIDAYFTALAVPPTVMTLTDRLALRVFVTTSGRTLKLHTEDSHLSQVITTLSTGINAINGLTAQVQNLATGTAGTDFAISSTASTHTFNLPTASAANRGALSSADWSTFNGKQNNIGLTTVGNNLATLPNPNAIRYLRVNADNTVSALSASQLISDLGIISNIQLIKDLSVYSVVNTSTLTLFQTYALAANSLTVSDFIEIFGHFNTTQTTGTISYRLYINTAANLTGATLLGTFAPTLPNGNIYEFSRQIGVTAIGASGNLRLPNVNGNIIASGNLNSLISNITVNTTVTQYLMFAVQMSVTSATTTQQMVFARINR
jgi:hypothetical protein